MASNPLDPSTIVSRQSAAVGPTKAIRATLAASANDLTHSAPQRVLPHPRPANTSHVDQSPGGGNCSDLAFDAQSHSSASAMLLKALIAAPQREQDRRSPRRLAGCRPWRTGDQARLPRHHARAVVKDA